jgi:hypothetical protein
MIIEHIQTIAKDMFNSIHLLMKIIPQFSNLSINDQNILLERNIRSVGSIDGINI